MDRLNTRQDRKSFLRNLICFAGPVEGLFFFLLSFSMIEVAAQDSIVFTADYQEQQKEYAKKSFLKQKSSVRCSGETVFFTGAIDHSSVRKLFELVNMSYPASHSEIAEMLSEIGVSYHTDMPLNLRICDNTASFEDRHYKYHRIVLKEKQAPVQCQPKKLVISSTGGGLTAALRLYYFVWKNSLSVEIPNNGICMSACTHIQNFSESFSAGPDSLFMFHRPHFIGHTIKFRFTRICQTYEQFITDQNLEAFLQLGSLLPNQVKENINQFEDFFVPYHVLKTWN